MFAVLVIRRLRPLNDATTLVDVVWLDERLLLNLIGHSVKRCRQRQVRKLFDTTKESIRRTRLPEEQNVDLYNGLYAYLKLDLHGRRARRRATSTICVRNAFRLPLSPRTAPKPQAEAVQVSTGNASERTSDAALDLVTVEQVDGDAGSSISAGCFWPDFTCCRAAG